MLVYAIKRVGLALLILIVVMTAMYAMVFLVPGDPASLALGPRATPALKAALQERMGLDQPIAVQLWRFLTNAVTGDLGYDVWSKRPVLDQIKEFFPNTLILGAVALSWAMTLGVLLGCAAVVWRGTLIDRALGYPFRQPDLGPLVCHRHLCPADLCRLAEMAACHWRRHPR